MEIYFKLARPDGWDFRTGRTINYRENVGKKVFVPRFSDVGDYRLCSDTVIHASRRANDCFVGASIPCSAYEVEGTAVVEDEEKSGFLSLNILREIEDLDGLFGWKYSEAVHPIYPFKIFG